MILSPSRYGVFALVLTAGILPVAQTRAQTAPAVRTDSKERHFAPHDTFYLLDYVSARTDKGVEGFVPGAEVHLVAVNREAHTLTVTDGHAQVEVPPDKLTNDTDIAALVRAKDQANQAQVAAYQQAEAKTYQEYEKQVADYTAKDLEKRQQALSDAGNRTQNEAEATPSRPANTEASNNGYYDEGGYGYGNPYGYFVNLGAVNGNRSKTGGEMVRTPTTSSGRGGLSSSQTTTIESGGGGRQGGAAGGGQAAGGKKP